MAVRSRGWVSSSIVDMPALKKPNDQTTAIEHHLGATTTLGPPNDAVELLPNSLHADRYAPCVGLLRGDDPMKATALLKKQHRKVEGIFRQTPKESQ